MAMKSYRIFLLLLLFWGEMSCYDDLGNYTYHDINELTIDSVASFYTVDQFDTLEIHPVFTGTQYADTDRFSYIWEIDGDTVSSQAYLRYKVLDSPGEKYCRFIVIDKETGVKEYNYFYTTVVNAVAVDGIVLLGDYQGHAELSFKRLDRLDENFQVNIFNEMNKGYLGTVPQSMTQVYSFELTEETDLYGLHILADNEMKRVSYRSLLQDNSYPVYNATYFKSLIPPNPNAPDFGSFSQISATRSDMLNYSGDFMGLFSKKVNHYFINDGKYFMTMQSAINGGVYVCSYLRGSESGGRLSPVFFTVSKTKIGNFSSFFYDIGYATSDYMILFDETNHKFVYGSYSGLSNFKEITEFRDKDFSGWWPIFGSPTRNINNPFVILTDGSGYRCLMLRAPQNSNEYKEGQAEGIKFAILGDFEIPAGQMDAFSDFYCYITDENFYFTKDNVLYAANLQSMLNGSWSIKPVCKLSDFGYNEKARINCFDFTRSGKYVALGISRDGKRKGETSADLNGDVLLLQIDKTSNAVAFYKKFEQAGGTPTDIIFKYLTYYCEGYDYNQEFRDDL